MDKKVFPFSYPFLLAMVASGRFNPVIPRVLANFNAALNFSAAGSEHICMHNQTHPMKKVCFLLLALALALSACTKDENGFDIENTLHYDSGNQSAPNLPAGQHEAAARFGADKLASYTGRNLTEIYFFLASIPDECTVKIYGPGSSGQPGALLYSATVSKSLKSFDWNRHELRRPIPITGDDLWVSIALTHSTAQQSIGCDAGPANGNGDWLYQDLDQAWKTFQARTRTESINWNIRAKVSE